MRKFLVCLLLAATSLYPTRAYALATSVTPATEFAQTAPVLITAYQTTGLATELTAVEIYNSADTLVQLTDWKLEVVTKDTAVHDVAMSSTYTGRLLPGEHAVASVAGPTTYTLARARQTLAITSIQLVYTGIDTVYRPVTALIKDGSDVPFFRGYTTTGYSTAAQPFAASPSRDFYDDGLYQAPAGPAGLRIAEVYPYASDCAPSDTAILCGDYIKLLNTTDTDMQVDELVLRTDSSSSNRTSSNTFTLAGIVKAHDVVTIHATDAGGRISLTNSGGYVWLEDVWGLARYDETMTQYESAGTSQQGYAYALDSAGSWQWTTTPQPAGTNVITAPVTQLAECPEGKYRNPDTNRCRTIEEAVNALSVCEEGYERNPVTNRCRKIATATTAGLTPCKEGQERNPATNRCRSIASAVAELIPCDEGYERNPATNRCRKLKQDTVPEAAFAVAPTAAKGGVDMAGWWAFAGVSAIAITYAVWEWRQDIARAGRRALGIFGHSK